MSLFFRILNHYLSLKIPWKYVYLLRIAEHTAPLAIITDDYVNRRFYNNGLCYNAGYRELPASYFSERDARFLYRHRHVPDHYYGLSFFQPLLYRANRLFGALTMGERWMIPGAKLIAPGKLFRCTFNPAPGLTFSSAWPSPPSGPSALKKAHILSSPFHTALLSLPNRNECPSHTVSSAGSNEDKAAPLKRTVPTLLCIRFL